MKKTTGYKAGNLLSYAEYGAANGYPILIQHGLNCKFDIKEDGVRLLPKNFQRSPLPRQHVLQHNQIWHNRVGIELHDTLGSMIENNQMHDNLSDSIIKNNQEIS